ncbi:filamentous hemagglutinin N-terminal domain-containing protein, partial [Neisseria sp.]|uniref:filamentous hemagglutinin N-terminal domain-containing protein n=1 Tax=Neisseria sp. TaxID=192066 RepID=UPI0026DC6EB7
MMAVAENTAREGKNTQDGGAEGAAPALTAKWAELPKLALFLVLAGSIGFARAQIVADKGAPAGQRPVVLKTRDGAPLVNIQTPDAKGLSHNRYTQFDVGGKGAVLNNSRSANPYLAKGTAQLILNEVRSNNPSRLNGIISVEGTKADVVVANPAGIQINGGGFKNARHAVVTTGMPVFKNGTFSGLDVRKGTVTVESGGFDSRGADYTEILSRSLAVQGKIHASNLIASTGAYRADYQTGETAAGTAEGTKPAAAIDTAALGGIYANSIMLIANEKGVGVKNAGTLQAQRQLTVTSAGRIENRGNIRTTALSTHSLPTYLGLEATGSGSAGAVVSDGGRIESRGLLVIESGEDIGLRNNAVVQNTGMAQTGLILDAGRNLVIENSAAVNNHNGSVGLSAGAKTIVRNSTVRSGTVIYSSSKADTAIQAGGRLDAKNSVTLLSNRNIGIEGGISAQTGSIHIEAAKPPSLAANSNPSDITLNNGSLNAARNVVLLAENNINARTGAVKSAGNLYMHADKNLNLTVDSALPAGLKDISLKAAEQAAVKSAAQTLAAAGSLAVEAGNIEIGNTHLKAASGSLTLSAAKGGIRLNAGGGQGLRLEAGRDIEAAATAGNIVSDGLYAAARQGHVSILASGNADLNGETHLNGQTGVYAGSVGRGRLKAVNTDIHAASGGVELLSGGSLEYGGGARRNTVAGSHISAASKNGDTVLRNVYLNAKAGALNINAAKELGLYNVQTASAHNTVFSASGAKAYLNGVDAESGRHMAVSSKGQVLQNTGQPSRNSLKAAGVLSIQGGWWNHANNSLMQGGAVSLKSEHSSVNLSPTADVKAVSNPVLRNDAALKNLDGSLNIEAGQQVYLHPGKTISADGDIGIKAAGRLTLAGRGGSGGNPSAQVSTLSAKGGIRMAAGEVGIHGAGVYAGKDLSITSRQGKLEIRPVKNTFDGLIPAERVGEMLQDIHEISVQTEQLKRHNLAANLLRIRDLNNEKIRLIFQTRAVNKEVKGHKPRGSEHKRPVLNGQNVSLLSAQGIDIAAADITAEKRLEIHAAGLLPQQQGKTPASVAVTGATDTYETGRSHFKSHYDKAVLNKPSRLTGKQGVSISAPFGHADARIDISGSKISAPNGSIGIEAFGGVVFGYNEDNVFTFLKTKGKGGGIIRKTSFNEDHNHLISPAPAVLSAGSGITVKSGGNIDAYSTRFNAPAGRIGLTAGEELNLLSVQQRQHRHYETTRSSRLLGIKIKNRDYSRSESNETGLAVKVTAKGVNTRSGWDTVLEGTEFQTGLGGAKIEAGVGEKARAGARVILKGITDCVAVEENSRSASAVWQRTAGSGSISESLRLPRFEGPAAPVLTAPGGYLADIPKGRLKDEIAKLAAQPGYGYLNRLQTAKNTDW